MTLTTYTDQDMQRELRRAIDAAGSIHAFVLEHELPLVQVLGVVTGSTPITAGILKALGFERAAPRYFRSGDASSQS